MTIAQRRFWLWVNVVCLAVAIACILVGLAQGSHPVLQGTLIAVGVVAFIFGVSSALVVAFHVRKEQRRQ